MTPLHRPGAAVVTAAATVLFVAGGGVAAAAPLAASDDGGRPVWVVAGIGLLVAVSLALTVVSSITLAWMLHAWRTPETMAATRFDAPDLPPAHRFSLLVPARHEEPVLGATLDRLAAGRHPNVEILAIVGHDDPGTEAVARAAAERHPNLIRVVIDHTVPKTKPAALNTALAHVTGDVVGVFDAEDEVHPELLLRVDAFMRDSGAAVVQGGVQLVNLDSSWWALRNCLEYFFWYRSRLHFHAHARFVPLGGNTVFLRADLIREADGWDAGCLAEDCELGVRLSADGADIAVAYDPELATREETPPTIAALIRQRTRWDQGFLQVFRKGEWRRLPLWTQRALARYTLAMPFLQAFSGLMIPVSAALMIWAKVPTPVMLTSFLPLAPTFVTLVVEVCALAELSKSFALRARAREYILLVLGTFPYQVLLAFAAVRSVWRELRGERGWEKTAHVGAHRVGPAAVEAAGEPVTVVLPAGAAAVTLVKSPTPGPLAGSDGAAPHPDPETVRAAAGDEAPAPEREG
ncbi:glycosyltransferase [Embleya hyalina]|uniref:N-acetylglucosaminyltransferase n=1 Tax=Embleya hyalina TaxID=516124 RepID=A0A401YMG8_9ACTN|nr:glycosyltransferase family 2 protein [Embleya hyalina]GCD95813.1 N-acetylglucosaminyltransferase [Embleya hyalina]